MAIEIHPREKTVKGDNVSWMSPMPTAYEKSKILPAITMVFLFIFANLIHLDFEQDWLENDDMSQQKLVTTQYSVLESSNIISSQPNDNFYRSSEAYIGVNTTSEGVYMLRFPVTLSQTQVITSATVELTCQDITYTDSTNNIHMYSAYSNYEIDHLVATWIDRNTTHSWSQPGVVSTDDRSEWDLPSTSVAISNQLIKYNLNVTKHLQSHQTMQFSNSYIDLVISGVGGTTQCATESNLTSNFQPLLTVTTQTNQYGDGGSVSANFVAEGAPLMKNQKLLEANTLPTISYENLTGSHVEFQFSSNSDFRNNSEPYRVYSTINNQFTATGNSGQYAIPQSDEFLTNSIVYYRYRSIDNTSTISNWTTSHFLLPNINAALGGDGSVRLSLNQETFSDLGLEFIEDASVYSATSLNNGDDITVPLTYDTNNAYSIIYMRVNMQYLGLSSNSTIIDAKLKLTTSPDTVSSMQVSSHVYDGPNWQEDEIRYGFYSNGQAWDDGGLGFIKQSTDVEQVPSGSLNVIDFDFDIYAQNVITSPNLEAIDLALIGQNPSEVAASLSKLGFYSTESNSGYEPVVEITYDWTPSNHTDPVELIEPSDGRAVWNLSGHNISGNETPVLSWNSSTNPNNEIIIQIATDDRFRNIILSNDSRVDHPILSGNGSVAIPSDSPLPKGQMYHWRVANYDSYGRLSDWSYDSFLVSSLTSTYLGSNNRHMIELKLGLESLSENLPGCRDASISSQFPTTNSYGSPYIGPSYSVSQGETVALLQCDVFNYLLPDGYAVESSNVNLNLINSVQTPEIGVWEGLNHQWNEREVTWNNFDSTNPWSQAGANGLDRGSILDTTIISSSTSNTYEWNVTYAAQKSMRNADPLDLIFAVLPSTASSESALFASHFHPQTNNHPVLKIIYIPGSDELPAQPVLEAPANGQFIYNDDFLITPNIRHNLNGTTRPH